MTTTTKSEENRMADAFALLTPEAGTYSLKSGSSQDDDLVFSCRALQPQPQVFGEAVEDEDLVGRLVVELPEDDIDAGDMGLGAISELEFARMQIDRHPFLQQVAGARPL